MRKVNKMKKSVFVSLLTLGVLASTTACGASETGTSTSAASETTASQSSEAESTTGTDGESSASAEKTSSASDDSTFTGDHAAGGGNGVVAGQVGGGYGGLDKSSDAELQNMISELTNKFTVETYTDESSGLSVDYNIFLPEDYDASKSYPMVVFIGDSSTTGDDPSVSLTQGWGGLIWASDEEQAKHECIVLVPSFPVTILDDNNGGFTTTEYVDLVPDLISSVEEKYSVDSNRIYATGQSMGCMTMLITAVANPNLFAAELFVDGQWDISTLSGLESQKFFYVVAEGDEKAYEGQTEVKDMLTADGLSYVEATDVNAKGTEDEVNATIKNVISQDSDYNFVSWTKGTVLPESADTSGKGASEHMAAFDYAYKFSAIRDWLFTQSKA
jgi:predicted peptidase